MAESTPRGSISKSTGQRTGKYRHLYGEPAKPEFCFSEIKNPSTTGESTYVKANSKYFAVAKLGGGGPVYIRRLNQPGRFPPNAATISVHKATALDFDFNPFFDNMIATGSEDTHVCVTKFPVEGLKETIQEPDVRLQGHGKKVSLVEFNPSANYILASAAFDHSVRVWNIETGKNLYTYDALDDNVYSMGWNHNGSLIGATGKDKKLQIFDPRQSKAAHVVEAFEGVKPSKIFWVPCLNWIGATGYSKTAKREIKLWDLNNMSKPLEAHSIDAASSVLQPMYDNDIGVLYLVGKGDGTITYYELANDDKKIYPLSAYRNPEPQKGGGWVGKKGLDVRKCEVARFLKLTTKSIIPISFIVPRKTGTEIFQADIYPDAFAGKPALSAEEWCNGQNKSPVLMALDPSTRQDLNIDTNVTNNDNDDSNNNNNKNNNDNDNNTNDFNSPKITDNNNNKKNIDNDNKTNTDNDSKANADNKNNKNNNNKNNAIFNKNIDNNKNNTKTNTSNDNKNNNTNTKNVESPEKRSYDEVVEENTLLKSRIKELEIKLGIYNATNEEVEEDAKVENTNMEDNPTNDTNNNENDLNQE